MIFATKGNYGLVDSNFTGNYKLFYAYLDSFREGRKASPSDATSIDVLKRLLVIKTYNEHSERALMGAQQDIECEAINFIDKSIHKLNQYDFSYGFNPRFGISDTTGTASGHISRIVLKKAVLELIEKNELFLFWYGKHGVYIEPDNYIRSMVCDMNFISPFADIFLCNELSNFFTAIVILRSTGRLTSSGIAISSNLDDAISHALQEAKLLEWCHYGNTKSPFEKTSDEVNLQIVEHIDSIKSSYTSYESIKKQYSNDDDILKINDFVKSIYFRVLNLGIGKRELTIKCISEELFNCLPRTDRIKQSMDKKIIKHFGLDLIDIDGIPNCVLM